MENLDFTTLSHEEFLHVLQTMAPNQVRNEAKHLTQEQASQAAYVFKDQRDKTIMLFEGIEERPILESMGKALASSQVLDLLEYVYTRLPQGQEKITPLLVGMTPRVFAQMLHAAQPHHMQVLKLELAAEPIQHHLIVLMHDVSHHMGDCTGRVARFEEELDRLDVTSLGQHDVSVLFHRIAQLAECYEETVMAIKKALSLAWNSNRPEVIDKLSILKEMTLRSAAALLGKKRTHDEPSTGIFAKLENRLSAVYGNPADAADLEALSDDDSVLEGLAKFSIWYLEDYWKLGLLPEISSIEELDNPSKTEGERLVYKERLFEVVQENLRKLGLNTIADLKQARIFSRKMLEEHVARTKSLLS